MTTTGTIQSGSGFPSPDNFTVRTAANNPNSPPWPRGGNTAIPGFTSSFISMAMNGSNPRRERLRFQFVPAVTELCFTLTDLDRNGTGSNPYSSYRDRVTIRINGARATTSEITWTFGPGGTGLASGTNPFFGNGRLIPETETRGNVFVATLPGVSVSDLRVVFRNAGGTGSQQWIGVSDLRWCTP